MTALTIRVPAKHLVDVADVIRRIVANGTNIDDLFVEVREGELHLREDGASYGARQWRS